MNADRWLVIRTARLPGDRDSSPPFVAAEFLEEEDARRFEDYHAGYSTAMLRWQAEARAEYREAIQAWDAREDARPRKWLSGEGAVSAQAAREDEEGLERLARLKEKGYSFAAAFGIVHGCAPPLECPTEWGPAWEERGPRLKLVPEPESL